jgi:putative acetyltransferase
MKVITERTEDIAAVRNVHILAFGRDREADLVDRLRGIPATFSYVAVAAERVVGHIFFSPIEIAGVCPRDVRILGLAPVAVLPDLQRQGIGSALIWHGLQECARLGFQAIVVLGWPAYYPRFGFIPARHKGLDCEYAVPDEVFMVRELTDGALAGCCGTVKYRSEFIDL